RVVLLTGSVKGRARTAALAAIAAGEAHLVVGTHAVLSEPVAFKRLGFAVTDEQHRFGVRQRGLLAAKALRPHLLVMSATPIPRTLALLIFGDLDVSVLDELPPGRRPVKTYAVTGAKRRDMFGFLAKQVAAGRQVYIVCPLIEEGESDLQAAAAYADEVARPLLPNARVGLMHGRLKAAEKAEVMRAFKEGEIDVLVSTTVIEVGVDVPNATVMVVEDAERYGLSALHQLRGRVGRGAAESTCILVTDHATEAARERLRFLCQTQDGFAVAKYDLETRGPGDFFGSRQHGLPTLRIADLAADTRVLKAAQEEAVALLRQDPALKAPQHAALAEAVAELFDKGPVMN
ncbi:MAG: helicase-related protein, partial [Oscillospiraceae bacterium]